LCSCGNAALISGDERSVGAGHCPAGKIGYTGRPADRDPGFFVQLKGTQLIRGVAPQSSLSASRPTAHRRIRKPGSVARCARPARAEVGAALRAVADDTPTAAVAVVSRIDPAKLGIAGGSAGGHLSLMQGCAPKKGNPDSKDPVEQQSSKVAAVACLFPPTDFLNYGKEGEIALGDGTLKGFRPPFDFWEREKGTNKLVVIEDQERRKVIGKQISPVYHVTKESAPALIIHGDADNLVPIQQAELIIAKFKENNVPCELVVRKGAGHGGPAFANDPKVLADWFDKYLLDKK
jgi:pimeloyl-ACP methyl ester carboxylesterase